MCAFRKLKPQKTQVKGSGGALKTSLSTLAVGVIILSALAGLVAAAIFAVRRKKSGAVQFHRQVCCLHLLSLASTHSLPAC